MGVYGILIQSFLPDNFLIGLMAAVAGTDWNRNIRETGKGEGNKSRLGQKRDRKWTAVRVKEVEWNQEWDQTEAGPEARSDWDRIEES